MKNKHILILGAGVYQVPLIQKAIDFGYYVTVASYGKHYPGMKIADDVWNIDTKDKITLLNYARKSGIDAVVTTGTDVAIPSIGYLNDKLGLNGINYETALNTSNKILMQKCFKDNNVPSANFFQCSNLSDCYRASEELGFPLIIKAPNSSGSRGIKIVYSIDDLNNAFNFAKNVAQDSNVLIEEFLTGKEFGAQAVVLKRKIHHFFCFNDTVTQPPIRVPIGHSCPSNLSEDIIAEAKDVSTKAIHAIGIENAVCNFDLIFTENGVKIFEIGARTGATGIPEIISLHHGIDLYQVALSIALGEIPKISAPANAKVRPSAAVRIIKAPRSGKLVSCHIPEDMIRRNGVKNIEIDYTIGSSVSRFRVGPDRIGSVIVVGEDPDSSEKLAKDIISEIIIEVR